MPSQPQPDKTNGKKTPRTPTATDIRRCKWVNDRKKVQRGLSNSRFIRFRLRPNDLTGYVIAVDYPQEDGGKLKPKLIEIFHLKAVEPSESKAS